MNVLYYISNTALHARALWSWRKNNKKIATINPWLGIL